MKISFVLPLLLLGSASHGAIALAQSPGMFSVTGGMTMPRSRHTATLLPNGKVLVAGGYTFSGLNTPLATAELYDPSTGAFTATGNMTTPRAWHSATLLPDGRVLIAFKSTDGGQGRSPISALTPAAVWTNRCASILRRPAMKIRFVLPDGKVLIAGTHFVDGEEV